MNKSFIYGIHTVETALKHDAKNLHKIYLDTRQHRFKPLLQQAKVAGIFSQHSDTKLLNKLSHHANHQGVVAEYSAAKKYHFNDLLQLLQHLNEAVFLLILDGVTDPHNLGACLRTAEGAGVHAVIIPKDNAVGMTPTVRKVASGAAETIPLIEVTNLARTMKSLKEKGIWMIGSSDKVTQSLYQTDLVGDIALLMGAEGKGLRRLTEKNCDFLISIPMQGKIPSLNVSVATGVCLYEAVRQRAIP